MEYSPQIFLYYLFINITIFLFFGMTLRKLLFHYGLDFSHLFILIYIYDIAKKFTTKTIQHKKRIII